MRKIDFYKACKVPTSNYDEDFAKINVKWLVANKIYNQKAKEGVIPYRFHTIWLGGELPERYKVNIETWKDLNQQYDFFFWGDDEAESLISEADHNIQQQYREAKNYGQKSDILRYLILYKIGGVYADIDFVCLGDFEELHNVNFFAGICLEKEFQLNNGLMASNSGHRILENCLNGIEVNGHKEIACDATRTLYQTGPWVLTNAVNKYIFEDCERCPDDVMFWPPNYFHPFPAAKRNDENEFWEDYIKEYSLACHLWECSWQK